MAISMAGPARLGSIPKLMAPIYEKVVGLTDDVCKRQLNSEYRDLARAMAAALCRKRPSPLRSGQPRTWACSIVYVLGDPSFPPHMTTAELCAEFQVGESTVHAKARDHRKRAWDWTIRSAVDAAQPGREESAGVDGRSEWSAGRFAGHATRGPGNCLRRWIDSLYPGGSENPIVNEMGAS